MSGYTDYQSAKDSNRKGFEQNYGADVQFFEAANAKLCSIWERLGTTRDKLGHSHAGLLQFANILRRHCILGFENIATYQSYLMWSNFRAGLEALLIVGKFVDNPVNAKVWLNRSSNQEADKKAYSKTFSGQGLRSKSLSLSGDLRDVLTRINDNFMHPNPDFTYRDSTQLDEGSNVLLRIELFDLDPGMHEANLLAYLNLVAVVVEESCKLVVDLLGSGDPQDGLNRYEKTNELRARQLGSTIPGAKKILEDYGLWRII
jgi:hypothetical protein